MTDYEEYLKLMDSGMLWELFPDATGNWEEDAFIFRLRNDNPQHGESL